MILKSMSRKGSGKVHFPQLFDYIQKRAMPGYEIWHNFNRFQPGRSNVLREFIENGKRIRNSPRHNIVYHEIISLQHNGRDLDEYQLEALHDLAQKYLAQRAGGQLAYGSLHVDKSHSIHMHLMISANDLGSQRRVRLPKFEFLQIQKDMETYLHQRHPQLEQKIIYNKPWELSQKKSEREEQLKDRTGGKTKKEQLRDSLETIFQHAPNFEEAGKALQHFGVSLEERGKHLVAQQGKLRCRIKTLGLDKSYEAFVHRLSQLEQGRESESPSANEPMRKKYNHKKYRATRPSSKRNASAVGEVFQELEKEIGRVAKEKFKKIDPLEKLQDFWIKKGQEQQKERSDRNR